MKTWNKELKQHWIETMQEHQDADRITQGRWWADGKGCFFGCAMQTEDNPLEKASDAMQLPAWLIYLAEAIHEGLPEEDALVWPVQLCKAIPCDTDIEVVEHKIAILRLKPLAEANPSVSAAVDEVIACHKKAIAGEGVIDWSASESAARSARSAARSAADSAADSAARSAARSARSAARSAWSAARSAVWSAARSERSAAWSARSAAWSAEAYSARSAWQKERDNLLAVLVEFESQ